jgi:hypothetical protein
MPNQGEKRNTGVFIDTIKPGSEVVAAAAQLHINNRMHELRVHLSIAPIEPGTCCRLRPSGYP